MPAYRGTARTLQFASAVTAKPSAFKPPVTKAIVHDPVKTPPVQKPVPKPVTSDTQLIDLATQINAQNSTNINQSINATNAADLAINSSDTSDTRIRLRAQRGSEEQVYGKAVDTNLLNLLNSTDGLLFPYTPSISVSHPVNYGEVDLVHTNGDIMTYQRTPSVTIEVTGRFTVQNQREGRYALAALHFLSTVSKMYFGETDKKAGLAGLPPPVLIFRGYGNYMYNNIPVIVKSHNYSFDEHVNTITIQAGDHGIAVLPSIFQISISLVVQQTPAAMRKKFSLDAYRTGELLKSNSGTGWI